MQFACLYDTIQLLLQADDLIVNRPSIAFDLGFAGASDKTETAALTFQMGPGADKAGALIAECGQFNLQNTFAGPGAVGKDFKDQTGPVKQLDVPFLLQIALLHRPDGAVNQNKVDLQVLEPALQFLDLARAEQRAGLHFCQPHHFGAQYIHPGQGCGQCDGLGQTMLGQTPPLGGFQVGMQHIGARQRCRSVMGFAAAGLRIIVVVEVRDYSSPS